MGYLQLYRQTDTVLYSIHQTEQLYRQTDTVQQYTAKEQLYRQGKVVDDDRGCLCSYKDISLLVISLLPAKTAAKARQNTLRTPLSSILSSQLIWESASHRLGFYIYVGPNTAGRLLHRVQHSWPITLPTSQRESTILFSVFKHLEDNTKCSLCVTNMEADYHTDNFLRYAPASVYCTVYIIRIVQFNGTVPRDLQPFLFNKLYSS